MPPRLRVPPRAVSVMSQLASLRAPQLSALSQALETVPTSLASLESHISDGLGRVPLDVGGLLEELFALAAMATAHQYSPDQVSEDVANSEALDITAVRRKRLSAALKGALTSRAVMTLGKALDLSQEYERKAHATRIVSDARPVFVDVDQTPAGVFISHVLRIDYVAGSELKSISLSMPGDTLSQLRDALDRADRKEAALKNLFQDAGTPVFDVSLGDGE